MHVKPTAIACAVAVMSLAALSGCNFESDVNQPTTRMSGLELRDTQRAFWVDHVTWSQTLAISTLNNLGDREVEYDRYLKGLVDYDATLTGLYGENAAQPL